MVWLVEAVIFSWEDDCAMLWSMENASGPLILISASAPAPRGVQQATIVLCVSPWVNTILWPRSDVLIVASALRPTETHSLQKDVFLALDHS